MKEEERIKLWLALHEEGYITDGERYIDEINIMRLLDDFGVSGRKAEREILVLLAWGVIEKVGECQYRRKKSWKPSLGMLFLDKMETMHLFGERTPRGKTP